MKQMNASATATIFANRDKSPGSPGAQGFVKSLGKSSGASPSSPLRGQISPHEHPAASRLLVPFKMSPRRALQVAAQSSVSAAPPINTRKAAMQPRGTADVAARGASARASGTGLAPLHLPSHDMPVPACLASPCGMVTVRFNHFRPAFPIFGGRLAAATILDELSISLPREFESLPCRPVLRVGSPDGPVIKASGGSPGEDADSQFAGLTPGATYWLDVERG